MTSPGYFQSKIELIQSNDRGIHRTLLERELQYLIQGWTQRPTLGLFSKGRSGLFNPPPPTNLMKIEHRPPPNYEEIKKHFPTADYEKGTLFTYGDTCYCKTITPDLVIHEETHTRQQTNPEEWWAKYFTDVDFRLSQELEAYQNQYRWAKKNFKDRNQLAKLLHHIVSDLSGKIYGEVISFHEAKKQITL